MIDLAYVAAGAVTGLVVGITGVGGGALMTPILLIFFNVAPLTAIATDLWFAAITKIAGSKIHHDSGQVDWQVAKRLWAGSIPMALVVVIALTMGQQIEKVDWLTEAIGIVTLVTAIGLLISPQLTKLARTKRINDPSKFKAAQPALTVIGGGVIGLCVALTSIGAGALGSIMLLYLYPLRMNPHRLVATDLVHAIPLAIVAGTGYLFAGLVDWNMLISLLAGSIPAIIAGSYLTRIMKGRQIQVFLSVALMAAAYKTLH